MKNIFIFDMDGTLTPSRRKMTKDFEKFFSSWAKNHTFFLVSGSNLEKIKEQVPEYILNLSEGVFTCGGNQLWLNGGLSYNHEFKPENDLLHFLEKKLHESPYVVRAGNHIEDRGSMLNFSVVGRGANQTERLVYSDWDTIKEERKGIAERFNEKFPELHAFVGGVTGVDISDKGSDKSQIIRDFQDGGVVFYGDRMEEGGNDKPLADAILNNKLGEVVSVTGWKDTWNKLR